MTTPSDIVEVLASVKEVRLDEDGHVEVMWKDRDGEWFSAREYTPNTFTRRLLDNIEFTLRETWHSD